MPDTRHVSATYDPESQVWWAESDDIVGLVSEAPTLDELVERVLAVVPELLQANGVTADRVDLQFVTTRSVELA